MSFCLCAQKVIPNRRAGPLWFPEKKNIFFSTTKTMRACLGGEVYPTPHPLEKSKRITKFIILVSKIWFQSPGKTLFTPLIQIVLSKNIKMIIFVSSYILQTANSIIFFFPLKLTVCHRFGSGQEF